MADVNGNQVKEVLVGEATRRMSRGGDDLPELRRQNVQLVSRVRELTSKKSEIQSRLAELNSEVQGKHLERRRYLAIVDEQGRIKSEIGEVERKLAEAKAELKESNILLAEIDSNSARLGIRDGEVKELFSMLRSIRNDLKSIKNKLGIE